MKHRPVLADNQSMPRSATSSYSVRTRGRFALLLAMVASLTPQAGWGQDQPGGAARNTTETAEGQVLTNWETLAALPMQDGHPLTSLRRLVRRFDFEEAQLRPIEMPLNFHRVVASNRGFPPFGSIGLRDDHAAGGRWSLRFDLDGGSMAVRMPTAVVPVLPHADYAISVRVRTSGLTHAFARVVGQFHDQRGELIAESRVESEPIRTRGEWTTVVINLDGDHPTAADMVLELQLLQPQATGSHDPSRPAIEDIHGSAWFDELYIWHMPRIDLTTGYPGNICPAGESLRLHARVIDMASEPLRAELWVYDHTGRQVHHAVFDPPVEIIPQQIALPITRTGWYRAIFDVHGRNTLVGRRWLDFLVLPDEPRVEPDQRPMFAVDLSDLAPDELAASPELVTQLGTPGVMLAPWQSTTTLASTRAEQSSVITASKQLLDDRRAVMFVMRTLPEELAASLGVDARDVTTVLADTTKPWRPYLEDVLIRYGLEVPRWIVGAAAASESAGTMQSIARNLADYVPNPELIAAVEMAEASGQGSGRLVSISPAMRTSAIEAELNMSARPPTIIELAAAKADFTPAQQLAEMMIRTLHAWRHSPDTVVHAAPWRRSSQRRGELMPDITFAGLHTLIHQLNGRSFVGTLDLGDNINAWILRGSPGRTSAIVAWQRGTILQDPTMLRMHLGGDRMVVTDAFGNRTPVHASGDRHHVAIHSTPVFIEGIDPDLALFRAKLKLDPGMIESAIRVQERQLLIHNPWPIAITGEIRLHQHEAIDIRPRAIAFAVGPGQTTRQPIECTPGRTALAGPTRLRADVTINADRRHEITAHIATEIGLDGIRLSTHWLPATDAVTGRRDLVISVQVRNDRSEPISLDAFALGPGISQNRTVIGTIPPGSSSLRHFTIPEGLDRLAGRTIRVGVIQRDGPARLNTLLEIPAIGASFANAPTSPEIE